MWRTNNSNGDWWHREIGRFKRNGWKYHPDFVEYNSGLHDVDWIDPKWITYGGWEVFADLLQLCEDWELARSQRVGKRTWSGNHAHWFVLTYQSNRQIDTQSFQKWNGTLVFDTHSEFDLVECDQVTWLWSAYKSVLGYWKYCA